MNIILVTGASSGIGREFVKQIDHHFSKIDEIWLIARRKERLQEVSVNCKHKCVILPLDLSKDSDLYQLELKLEQKKPTIKLLINSAGFGVMGSFQSITLKEQSDMIKLNCNALMHITYMCIPYMQQNSRIIQMSSSAAFFPQPYFATYAATKSFVLSFSRAINEELRKRRIFITNVCPGPVETEFFKIAEKYGRTLSLKKFFYVSPEEVVYRALRDSRDKKSISIYSVPIRLLYMISKLVPDTFFLWIYRFIK